MLFDEKYQDGIRKIFRKLLILLNDKMLNSFIEKYHE